MQTSSKVGVYLSGCPHACNVIRRGAIHGKSRNIAVPDIIGREERAPVNSGSAEGRSDIMLL
jgi:hypothetical protein